MGKFKISNMKTKITYLLLLAVLFGLNSCKECIDVDVPYTEREPYEATETYYETADYSVVSSTHRKDYDCLKENFWGDCIQKKWYLHLETTIENLESVPVEFTVKKSFNTYYDGDVELKEKIKIPAYGTRTVTMKHYLSSEHENYKKPTYSVDAGSVEKERTVTKYNTITKYRKCNTCVEDCGSKYKKKSKTPWWAYLIGGVFVLGIIGWILEKLGIID